VADENLASFFRRTQSLPPSSAERTAACWKMLGWAPCLFRALDYVHSMRIRHKDIKPANILIRDDCVYLTDFGISNDFVDLTTSRTDGAAGPATWMYAAPEVDQEQRRGRATDVWALGCVVMELCTVASQDNDLRQFEDHRRAGRSGPLAAAYYASPFRLFDWMWLLMGSPGPDRQAGASICKTLQLAFIMLDPDPQRRVTTRQLVDLLSDPRCVDFHEIGSLACDRCKTTRGMSPQDIPLHSVFKRGQHGGPFRPPKDGLSVDTPDLWEEIKRRWLLHHIWWANEPFF
jgi:serine/threonine protein kinase